MAIRNYLECENAIEKSDPRITFWHHEACRVMTNSDLEGPIFLFHTYNGVWGWDRKIWTEGHSLASWGLPSDNKWWSRGTKFSIPPSHKNGFFPCPPSNFAAELWHDIIVLFFPCLVILLVGMQLLNIYWFWNEPSTYIHVLCYLWQF